MLPVRKTSIKIVEKLDQVQLACRTNWESEESKNLFESQLRDMDKLETLI